MKQTIVFTLALFSAIAGTVRVAAQTQNAVPVEQTHYSPAIEAQIKQVEAQTGLVKFTVAGLPPRSITSRMAYYNVKGLSIAVVHDFKVVWAKSYGWADEKEQRPVTSDTRFEPGSISKSLNAVGVLRLAQEGKLDLDTDINNYLRSWTFAYDSVSRGKKITTAQLLSHTAGLTVHGFPGYFPGDDLPTLADILDGRAPAKTRKISSLAEPGIAVQYSGGGTMITQQMVTDITGLPYDKYMQQAVLQPLGMVHSSFTQPPPATLQPLLATGYDAAGNPMRGKYPILMEQAAGGLWTTATDLATFIAAMQLSLKGQSNKVLSAAMAQRMLRAYVDSSVGLGVFIENRNGYKYFTHSAANQGFRGIYTGSFEDGNGVVVLINSDNEGLLHEVVNSVARVYEWKGMPFVPPVVKHTIQPSPAALKQYTGDYLQGTTVVSLFLENEELWYKAGDAVMKVYFSAPDHFFNLESETEKVFYADTEGRIKGFSRQTAERDFGRMERVTPVTLTRKQLEPYTGTYVEPDGNQVTVSWLDNSLYLNPGNGPMKMNFISGQVFYLAADFGAIYKFDRTSGVTSLTGQKDDQVKIMKKIK